MSEIKLLPCPFCGGESLLRELYIIGVAKTKHYIRECRHCKATFAHRFRSIKKANEAWNRRADAVPVVRGEWNYTIKKGSCMNYSVTAKCSKCGWDWFSKDGVGNYSAVFGAFITNGDSKPEEAERFLLKNARANNKLNYCPNCGAKMEVEP